MVGVQSVTQVAGGQLLLLMKDGSLWMSKNGDINGFDVIDPASKAVKDRLWKPDGGWIRMILPGETTL